MSIDNFIPSVWSAVLLKALETQLQYAQPAVVNRDYTGDISGQGDRVKINSVGDVTVKAYTKNGAIDSPQSLIASQQELIIDQAYYFNFMVDDVDTAQATPKIMMDAMQRSSYALRKRADTWLAGVMKDAISTNLIGAVGTPKTDLGTAGKAYEYLVELSVLLDNSDTPDEGRFVIVPSWFHGALLKDSRFVSSGSGQAETRLANGLVGEAVGFKIYKSNNVPKATATTEFKIIAGHNIATSYVEQIVKVEAFRPPDKFGDAVKGLHVYGAKVVRPSNLAMLIANSP